MSKTSPSTKRRTPALLSVSAMAATALIATAGPAGAALSQGGGDNEFGTPAFLNDTAGLALQLCQDACVEEGDAFDPAHAVYFAANVDGLGPISGGWEVATVAVEDEAGNPTGEVAVVNGARFRALRGTLTPGATYVLRGPWGRMDMTAEADGSLDHRVESGGEEGTLAAGPVQSFLRSVSATGDLIGLPAEGVSAVTGSPSGFNMVRVTRPNGTVLGETDQFNLLGQMAPGTAMTSVGTDVLSFNARTVTKTIRYRSFGTAAATPVVTKSGTNPAAFTVDGAACASVAPGAACNISVTFHPRANRSASAILTIDDNGLAAPRQVSLTGTGPDTLRPRIEARTPKAGADNVRLGKSVLVQFSETVRGVKGSFALVNQRTDRKVRASVQRVRQTNRWVLNPRKRLSGDTTYKVMLNGGAQALRDASGNAAADVSWRFHTR